MEDLISNRQNAIIPDKLIYPAKAVDFKEKLEELKAKPFDNVAKFVFMDYVAFIFGLKEPIEDLKEFTDSLTNEEEILVYNTVLEGYCLNIPSYDFDNFKLIPAEVEVDPNEIEVENSIEFLEKEVKSLENLPEWLKDRMNITEEKITAKKEKLLKAKNSSEENVPEEDSSEKVAAEDSSENEVPINEG